MLPWFLAWAAGLGATWGDPFETATINEVGTVSPRQKGRREDLSAPIPYGAVETVTACGHSEKASSARPSRTEDERAAAVAS